MFQLQTFGSVDLRNSTEQSVQSVLAQPRRTALLLYLAAASPQRFHRRDSLLALFWPESDAAQGRAALSQAIYFLRRSLSESVVISRGKEEVSIDAAHIRCDTVLFEEALQEGRKEEALALYRGDFLEGFHVSEAPQLEQWADTERARLKAQALSAAVGLSAEKEAAEDLHEALTWARRAQTIAPAEEAPVRQLVSLLAEIGERSEAIREYQVFAERIRVEFDLEPSPEMRALLAEIRARDVPAESKDQSVRTDPPPSVPAERGGPRGVARSRAGSDGTVDVLPAPGEQPTRSTSAPQQLQRGQVPRRWSRGWAAGFLLVLTGVFAAFSMSRSSPLEEGRVFVAAFENQTGDPALGAIGEMAADWIAQGLQQMELVDVIDPVSSLLLARENAANSPTTGSGRIAALARESGARTVISGTLYRQGDSLLYHAQITDARSGKVLYAIEPMAGSLADPRGSMEAIRSRIAGALASMLDERIASLSAPTGRPPTYEAYREYLAGLDAFTSNRAMESLPHFEAAARLDSTFSLPLIWAVFAYGNEGYLEQRDSVVQLLETRRDRLAPLDRHALDYFRSRYRENKPAALESARRAAQLAPGSQWSHNAGSLAMDLNRPREALEHLGRIDAERGWAKGWKGYWHRLTDVHHRLEQHMDELNAAERGRRLDPDFVPHRFFEIRALIALGRVEEAMVRLDEALLLSARENTAAGELAYAVALELRTHGYPEEAERQLEFAIDWFRSPAFEEWVRSLDHRSERQRQRMLNLLGESLYEARRYSEARAHFEVLSREYDQSYDAALGRIAARAGDPAIAERMLKVLEESKHENAGALTKVSREQARIAALLGDRTRTLAYLREFIRQGGAVDILHGHAEFNALEDDPAFRALMRPKG